MFEQCNVAWARPMGALVLAVALMVQHGCSGGDSPPPPPADHVVLVDLLEQPLWQPRDAYDAAHHLMVPLHAAWLRGDYKTLARWDAFWLRAESDPGGQVRERLDRLHLLYLLSRHVAMAAQGRSCLESTRRQWDWLLLQVAEIALTPAWQWGAPDFANLADRIRWRLDNTVVPYSYYRALIDEDLFTLALAADVEAAGRLCNWVRPAWVGTLLDLSHQAFEREVTTLTDGRWLLQAGVWADHPDYAYAGHSEVGPDLLPFKVPGIATDSSHSFRLPLFLRSLRCAMPPGDPQRARYEALLAGLARQWEDAVLVLPDSSFGAVRLTNFMDGRNGVYRYGHTTQGQGRGFGPFQLSGSFQLGWWAFLGASALPAYRAQLSALPLPADVVSTYTGPGTSRMRHPAFAEPGFHTGDLLPEVLEAAVEVAQADWPCH